MYIKNSFFLLLLLLLVSCSDVKNTRFRDTSSLEMPPEMEVVEKPKVAIKENEDHIEKGLGDSVSLAGTDEKPVMKIKKLFDRSWTLVEQALKLGEIEVTDKNREQGIFYVLFDPDVQSSGDSESTDTLSFFFFEDEYEEAAYQIKVAWIESDTEVKVELVNQINTDLLDDDEDKEAFEGTVDGGGKLLNILYNIIKNDLPLK